MVLDHKSHQDHRSRLTTDDWYRTRIRKFYFVQLHKKNLILLIVSIDALQSFNGEKTPLNIRIIHWIPLFKTCCQHIAPTPSTKTLTHTSAIDWPYLPYILSVRSSIWCQLSSVNLPNPPLFPTNLLLHKETKTSLLFSYYFFSSIHASSMLSTNGSSAVNSLRSISQSVGRSLGCPITPSSAWHSYTTICIPTTVVCSGFRAPTSSLEEFRLHKEPFWPTNEKKKIGVFIRLHP